MQVYWYSMIQGTLDRLHLGDLLQWFQMGGLSGRLTLIEGHQRRHLDFLDGRIVYASSTVPEERLASWLATEGLLPLSTLHRLLAVSLLRRTLFTNLLIERGGFSPEHLRNSLTRLAETITSRVLTASNVRFMLDPSYPVRQLLGLTLHVQPNSLVMEAARRSDEYGPTAAESRDLTLPTDDQGFENFFWQLIRDGISADERVDGEQVARLQQQVRDIVGTLSDWVASGSGLVPVPAGQAARVAEWRTHGHHVDLIGLPHATWNQMVLACAVRSPHVQHPETFLELAEHSASLDLWQEMSESSAWRRPTAGRIDEVTENATVEWCRTAEAAAPHIGVSVDIVRLAVHLMVVPTDLVLWVLATLPIPHQRLRNTLLHELPRRLGLGLARLSDFPDHFQRLFDLSSVTPLGTSLDLGRRAISSARVWPATLPASESRLQTVATPATLIRAAAAVRQASPSTTDSSAAAS
jgi:hypothetical protein